MYTNLLHNVFLLQTILVLVATTPPPSPAIPTFTHPGVFMNASDLSILVSRVAAKADPQTSALAIANSSFVGSLRYKPYGPPVQGIIACGPYDNPNIGCVNETFDADSALLHSMLYIITDNVAHAALSRKIINLYTSGLIGYADGNAPLQAGWCGSKWVRAAEFLRYTPNSGWTSADTDAFKSMIMNIHLPLIYNGSSYNGNWEMTMIEAMIGFSVFVEDAALFTHAVDFWRQRTPAYFYNFAADGNSHAPFPPKRGATSWYNQTVFNASTNGVCQETCRDLVHMQMGLGSCLNAAATARINGVDLFAEEAPRLTGAMEFASEWLLKGGSPQSDLLCSGKNITIGIPVATMEVGFRELGVRLNNNLSLVVQHLKAVRPIAPPDSLCSEWETLTHGEYLP